MLRVAAFSTFTGRQCLAGPAPPAAEHRTRRGTVRTQTHTPIDIDPDIARATSLPTAFYLDPALYALARERLFARSWQWLGTLDDVALPGSVSPRELLPGLLDEPLLLARDAHGALRCLSNVCTHRGNRLVDAPCQAQQLRCRYHGRRFGLDGRVQSMPGFDGASVPPSTGDDLPQPGFGSAFGHGFASIAPLLPLQEVLAEMQARLGWLPIAAFVADASRSQDYSFDAHWALYVENYLEGLHIPFVHAGLTATLDLGRYHYELGRASVLQLAHARDGEAAFDLPASSPDHGQRIAAYYWWLFPNLMLNFYPWGLSLNLVHPLGPARTRVLFRSFVANPADVDALRRGAGGALDAVELEDEAVVMSVQRGITSRLFKPGRYAPAHERGVHHFHRLVAEFMRGGA
jgi:choline monooxygenase